MGLFGKASPQVSCQQVKSWIDEGQSIQLIDVRSPAEFREGHVPGAVNIPLDTVGTQADSLNNGKKTVVICLSGGRANSACQRLQSQLKDVAVMSGGTMGWIQSGYPVES